MMTPKLTLQTLGAELARIRQEQAAKKTSGGGSNQTGSTQAGVSSLTLPPNAFRELMPQPQTFGEGDA
jgi:hypothetical protein